MPLHEHYRNGTLGIALTDTLDELIQAGHITPQLAIQVLEQFDRSLIETLKTQVKAKAVVKGRLGRYGNCDDVWEFVITNAQFRLGVSKEELSVDRIKIVARKAE
ncbi:Transcription initiation factor IIA subunit 2 [Coemansia spiralis]|nr:Transcription initiation factor IIA subunit 2 [Coemansia spiralis]